MRSRLLELEQRLGGLELEHLGSPYFTKGKYLSECKYCVMGKHSNILSLGGRYVCIAYVNPKQSYLHGQKSPSLVLVSLHTNIPSPWDNIRPQQKGRLVWQNLNALYSCRSKRNIRNKMPKRVGHIYEQLSLWNNLVACECACCDRKTSNYGVQMHIKNRWHNLVELQQMIINETIHTDEYEHEQRRSGQDKLRDIAKLKFHPNHIWHRDLVYVGNRRVDRSLINNTFASRVGYGQIKAALYIRDYIRKHPNATVWYCQGDFVKYYQNIKHSDIRKGLERRFKDERYINAFIEPFSKFSPSGKEIPLGINPSQTAGNIVRSPFDRYATEVVKCKGYMSYLDDFVFFGAAKGEVKRKMKQLYSFAEKEMDYELHIPKIRKLSEGLNTMGFVFYPNGSMFWRKTNKAKWLKRRSKVTNPKRKRELDAAAWGMLKWGNKHCRRLYKSKGGYSNQKQKKDGRRTQ